MRIWHVAESYPPDYGGGAAVTTREICGTLAERGHDVRVLSVGDLPIEPYAVVATTDGGIQSTRVNLPHFRKIDPEGWQLGLGAWMAHERRVTAVMRALVQEWRPDVVDYHAARPLGEACVLTLRSLGLPVVATLHDFWLICPRVMLMRSPADEPCRGPGRGRCEFCLYSHYDGSSLKAALKLTWRAPRLGFYPYYRLARRRRVRMVPRRAIARSEFIARVCRPHLPCEVRVIPFGVDQSRRPAGQPLRPRRPFRFGFVGGAQQTKGLELVLEAASRLAACNREFELLIWGPHADRAHELAAGRRLMERVRVMGTYAAEELWLAYAEMDAAIMATTVCEPFGRVPQEAAVSGVPAIVPAIGGLIESVVDGRNGLLFQFRSSDQLVVQMDRMLMEPGLYEQLRSGLQPVPEPGESIEGVEAVYRAAIGDHLGGTVSKDRRL